MRIVTKHDLVEALKKNGYPQTYGQMIDFELSTTKISACAMGQAAINLGVHPADLHYALNTEANGLASEIENWNDKMRWSIQQIAKMVEEDARDFSVEVQYDGFSLSDFIMNNWGIRLDV